jgi:hypothetical protein
MDTATYLAGIDSLCTGDLTTEHGESDAFMAGSRYRIVSLAASHGSPTGDVSERQQRVDDLHALKEHIALTLNARWGDQQPPWWMGTLVVRIDRGEEIPEPWATVSALVDELGLWQPPGTDRWLALGVADGDLDDEVHLLALVTDVDPP